MFLACQMGRIRRYLISDRDGVFEFGRVVPPAQPQPRPIKDQIPNNIIFVNLYLSNI